MCGIAGFVNVADLPAPDLPLLRRMAGAVAHRGPDEFGTYRDATAGLAHARLSIVDLVTGLVRPKTGEVFVDALPLGSTDMQAWRRKIGYVPQDDILHKELTVEQALRYSARLRLPEELPGVDEPARARQQCGRTVHPIRAAHGTGIIRTGGARRHDPPGDGHHRDVIPAGGARRHDPPDHDRHGDGDDRTAQAREGADRPSGQERHPDQV